MISNIALNTDEISENSTFEGAPYVNLKNLINYSIEIFDFNLDLNVD
jgi:hypothetical protein